MELLKFEKLKISILVPTFNRIYYLEQCLQSCINQSLDPFEICIGDDSTNDESKRYISNLAKNYPIKYVKNNPPLGQAKNVNSLIKNAQGDYICLIHDDDKLENDCLEKLSLIFNQNPNVIF